MPTPQPNIDLTGIIKTCSIQVNSAFEKGVKYGKYLEKVNRYKYPRCCEWLPVSETLPIDDRWCLAFCVDGTTCEARCSMQGVWDDRNGREITSLVSHWLILPEPPKEE